MNGAGCMTVARRIVAVLLPALRIGALKKLLPQEAGEPTPGPEGHEWVTITRAQLDLFMAAAVDDGWRRGYAAGKGLPKPDGLISDAVAQAIRSPR